MRPFAAAMMLASRGGSGGPSAGPAIRGSSLVQIGNVASYHAVLPAGAQAGDLVVLVVGHGWNPSVTTGGGTAFDSVINHADVNALSWRKVLTSTDITNNFIALTFSGTYWGAVGIVCFIGNPTGYRTSAQGWDDSASAGSLGTVSTGSSPAIGDFAIYYAISRADGSGAVDSVAGNPGTLLNTLVGTHFSAILRLATLRSNGAASAAPAVDNSTNGDYFGLIVIQP